MAKHAMLSPSKADRWMTCPGSIVLEKQLELSEITSGAAEDGTVMHEFSAELLRSYEAPEGRVYNARHLVGQESKDVPGRKFTVEMTEPVDTYVNEVVARAADGGKTLWVETEVPIGHLTGEDDATGTPDAVIITQIDETAYDVEVIDAKFGVGVRVSAEENKQMRMYALGVIEAIAPYTEGSARNVTMTIIQPRVEYGISEETLAVEDLFTWRDNVLTPSAKMVHNAVESADKSGVNIDTFTRSEKACRFCPVKAYCPLLMEITIDRAKVDFSSPFAAITNVKDATDEVIRSAVVNRSVINSYLDALEDEATRRMLTGQRIDGLKLVHKDTKSRWIDDDTAIKMLKKAGLKKDQYTKTSVIGITEAKKLVGKDSYGLIAEACEKPLGAIVAAAEGDKRTEAMASVIENHDGEQLFLA